MNIKVKPMGSYQTNCYILTINNKDFIIDPGIDASKWVLDNISNPKAIFNTHGHFDHVWSNQELKDRLKIPIYCPKDDAFMLKEDPFHLGTPKSNPDFLVEDNQIIEIEGEKFKFITFKGHSPGCSVIEFNNIWFSGDFLFKNSIGRWDLPFSNPKDMLNSLKRLKKDYNNINKTLLPGHGPKSSLKEELKYIDYWIEVVKRDI
ncbi:MAG: MBL fold metallo-hydrolase [Epsilonproteobacteria bacterium]|nr:MBL fold metallo-hydrolase [Campylobacterota bacterium]